MSRRPLLLLPLLALAACAVPPHRNAWDQWVSRHETVLIVHDSDVVVADALNGACGGTRGTVVVIDEDCLRRAGASKTQALFRLRHEEAHPWVLRSGLGDQMPGKTFLVRQEQAAQCVARVLTGTIPVHLGGETDARGYWTCDGPELAATRSALALAGLV